VTELGVSVIGGCCGTTPEHLAHVVDRCADLVPAPRTITHEPGASSLYSFVPFAQETSFLSVGERTNANGSKRFREAMLAGDFDLTTAMAREQVKEGSHLIGCLCGLHRRRWRCGTERGDQSNRHPGQRADRHRLHRGSGRAAPRSSGSVADRC